MIRGPGGWKSRLAKAAGAEVALKQRKEKWHARCGGTRIFKSKCTKHSQGYGATFSSSDLQKWHADCGEKHVSKSKCTKHTQRSEPLFQVQMSKNGTPTVARITFASQNAHKTDRMLRQQLDYFLKFRCRKIGTRDCGAKHMCKSKCYKHVCVLGTLFEVQMSKIARCCGTKHISKSKCPKHLRFGAILEVVS